MVNKRGSVIDILIWLVISFVTVAFLGMWAYAFNEVTTVMTTIEVQGSSLNISGASLDTFGQVNSAFQTWLPILSFVMIFASALSILISNFLVKVHPAFMIVYLMVIIGAVMGSVYISNAYEDLLINDIVGSTFQSWGASSYIMINLPIWVTVIGAFGMVFLFAGIMRDANQGGGI